MKWTTQQRIDEIVQRTRDGGAEIVGLSKPVRLLRPASAGIAMAESHLKDKNASACAAISRSIWREQHLSACLW
jgi:malate dehydrogenase